MIQCDSSEIINFVSHSHEIFLVLKFKASKPNPEEVKNKQIKLNLEHKVNLCRTYDK